MGLLYHFISFNASISFYETLGDFKDAKDMVIQCIITPFKEGKFDESVENFNKSKFYDETDFATFMKNNGYQSQIETYLNDFRKYEGLYLDTKNTSIYSWGMSYYYYIIKIDEKSWKFAITSVIGNKTLDANPSGYNATDFDYTYNGQIGDAKYTHSYLHFEINTNSGILYKNPGTKYYKQ